MSELKKRDKNLEDQIRDIVFRHVVGDDPRKSAIEDLSAVFREYRQDTLRTGDAAGPQLITTEFSRLEMNLKSAIERLTKINMPQLDGTYREEQFGTMYPYDCDFETEFRTFASNSVADKGCFSPLYSLLIEKYMREAYYCKGGRVSRAAFAVQRPQTGDIADIYPQKALRFYAPGIIRNFISSAIALHLADISRPQTVLDAAGKEYEVAPTQEDIELDLLVNGVFATKPEEFIIGASTIDEIMYLDGEDKEPQRIEIKKLFAKLGTNEIEFACTTQKNMVYLINMAINLLCLKNIIVKAEVPRAPGSSGVNIRKVEYYMRVNNPIIQRLFETCQLMNELHLHVPRKSSTTGATADPFPKMFWVPLADGEVVPPTSGRGNLAQHTFNGETDVWLKYTGNLAADIESAMYLNRPIPKSFKEKHTTPSARRAHRPRWVYISRLREQWSKYIRTRGSAVITKLPDEFDSLARKYSNASDASIKRLRYEFGLVNNAIYASIASYDIYRNLSATVLQFRSLGTS